MPDVPHPVNSGMDPRIDLAATEQMATPPVIPEAEVPACKPGPKLRDLVR